MSLKRHAPKVRILTEHRGLNRAQRRRRAAQARHQGDSPHGLGSLPAPSKKHIAKPHEARHLCMKEAQ